MRKVLVIGIGAGDPDHLTIAAVKALDTVQVFFIPDKGAEKRDLRVLREAICRRFISHDRYRFVEFAMPQRASGPHDASGPDGYRSDVARWHGALADRYADLLGSALQPDETGAFLVWGDPSLYDSTLRILDLVRARGDVAFDHAVIPGITSLQALAARHRTTLNAIGEPVLVTTGRRLADDLPEQDGTVAVMLDGEQAFRHVDAQAFDIVWGANLGLDDERLIAGRLADVAAAIGEARGAVRRDRGWVMDTYLLRRRSEP